MMWPFNLGNRKVEMRISDENLSFLEAEGSLNNVVAKAISLYISLKKAQNMGYTDITIKDPRKNQSRTFKLP